MAFWDSLIQMVAPRKPAQDARLPESVPAAVWPTWEQVTPQYPQPSPYNLALEGYRKNEIIYTLVRKRMAAISSAPVRVYRETMDAEEEQKRHPLRMLMKRPNPYLAPKQFWQYEACYKDIAGFSAWEIEFNNLGEPMALWPMLPHWCSFLRGDRTPFRAIRYQPYGLPPVDIPRENLLFFQDLDPLFPFIRGLSRSAVAMRIAFQDNRMTDFLSMFVVRGAITQGVLSVAQSLRDAEAKRLRDRWRDTHGGVENWTDIAVLGNGAQYQNTQMSFKDMDFSTIDGRAEGRMCGVFEVPPILLNARISMDHATLNNFKESRQSWYEGSISDEWEYLGSELSEQLLPMFGDDVDDYQARFDTSRVKSLQESYDALVTRAVQAYEAGTITRDEARAEMEYDPIDNADVFTSGAPKIPGDEEPPAPPQTQAPGFGGLAPLPFGAQPEQQPADAAEELKSLERRQFRTFAARRAKEGKPELAGEFRFKHLGSGEQRALLASVAMLTEQDRIGELIQVVREATAEARRLA